MTITYTLEQWEKVYSLFFTLTQFNVIRNYHLEYIYPNHPNGLRKFTDAPTHVKIEL